MRNNEIQLKTVYNNCQIYQCAEFCVSCYKKITRQRNSEDLPTFSGSLSRTRAQLPLIFDLYNVCSSMNL